MIELRNVGVRFGKRWVLRALSLQFAQGACVAVLGPNARGKTTLLRAIVGLQEPTEGSIDLGKLDVAYLPQKVASTFAYAVREFVVLGRARKVSWFASPSRADYRAADAALETLGIGHLSHRPIDRLSGGEFQLCALARALATEAQLVLLDEPAAALDLAHQAQMMRLIGDLRSRGLTVVFSTHQPQHAWLAASHALVFLPDSEFVFDTVLNALTEETLLRAFGVAVRRVSHSANGAPLDALVPVLENP